MQRRHSPSFTGILSPCIPSRPGGPRGSYLLPVTNGPLSQVASHSARQAPPYVSASLRHGAFNKARAGLDI